MPLLGCHVSIAGGIYKAFDKAQDLSCSAMQIFTKNQRRWVSRPITVNDIDIFSSARTADPSVKSVVAHGSYLTNFASGEGDITQRSLESLRDELNRCAKLHIPCLIIHPGAHKGIGETRGVDNVIGCLIKVLKQYHGNTTLCIETTAGQGTGIGYCFEHVRDIIGGIEEFQMGVCIDTCHIYSAGYDIRTRKAYEETMELFERIVGLDHLMVLHLNDSKGYIGSRVDRHTHIGRGEIGNSPFNFIMQDERFEKLPKIIETPKILGGQDMDRRNLDNLRKMVRSRK
jgi:deoxyribonuclease-4